MVTLRGGDALDERLHTFIMLHDFCGHQQTSDIILARYLIVTANKTGRVHINYLDSAFEDSGRWYIFGFENLALSLHYI